MDGCQCPAGFLPCPFTADRSHWNGASSIRETLPSSVKGVWRQPRTHTQRFYLLGDSESSQVDSADSPSGWSQIEPPAFLHPRQCLGTVLNSVMRILRTLGNLGICSALRTSQKTHSARQQNNLSLPPSLSIGSFLTMQRLQIYNSTAGANNASFFPDCFSFILQHLHTFQILFSQLLGCSHSAHQGFTTPHFPFPPVLLCNPYLRKLQFWAPEMPFSPSPTGFTAVFVPFSLYFRDLAHSSLQHVSLPVISS